MRAALFIPCYIDQLKPGIGLAALDVLDALGIDAVYPEAQTCCGQPFLTAGRTDRARALGRHYIEVFAGFDRIITLSCSCAATIRGHLPGWVEGDLSKDLARRTLEFCEFLFEHDGLERIRGAFPHRVGLHASCHALRDLRLGTPSETREAVRVDPAAALLSKLEGLELVELDRPDECCGFGGLFSIEEEAVSVRMGLDRLADHETAGAEIITSTDVSCLLHLDGLATKRDIPLRTLHVAEILAAGLRPDTASLPSGCLPFEEGRTNGAR